MTDIPSNWGSEIKPVIKNARAKANKLSVSRGISRKRPKIHIGWVSGGTFYIPRVIRHLERV